MILSESLESEALSHHQAARNSIEARCIRKPKTSPALKPLPGRGFFFWPWGRSKGERAPLARSPPTDFGYLNPDQCVIRYLRSRGCPSLMRSWSARPKKLPDGSPPKGHAGRGSLTHPLPAITTDRATLQALAGRKSFTFHASHYSNRALSLKQRAIRPSSNSDLFFIEWRSPLRSASEHSGVGWV